MDSNGIRDKDEEIILGKELEGDKIWLFKENIRLQNERKELERLRSQLDHEKEDLKVEMKKWTTKLKLDNDRISQEKLFFDKKFKILENGFRQLNWDKDSFNKEKLLFEARKKYDEEQDHHHEHNYEYEYEYDRNHYSRKTENSFYFRGVNSALGVKKRYKDLIKIFHPDNICGDGQTIVEINKEYEKFKSAFGFQKKA